MAADKQYKGFRLETGEITTLTFSGEGANIFSTPVLTGFIEALGALSASGTKALVLTGEGGSFMAGADINEMAGFAPEEAAAFARLFHRAMNAVEGLACPVIAGVNGFALGGGTELVLASDIAIASEAAVFGQPEINLGIIPGGGGTQRLQKRTGPAMAKELIFTGRRVGAHEALSLGLVNRVVAGDRLMEEVFSLARAVASKPRQCLSAAKSLINSGTLEGEIEAFSAMFSYGDQKSLMNEFLLSRKKRQQRTE